MDKASKSVPHELDIKYQEDHEDDQEEDEVTLARILQDPPTELSLPLGNEQLVLDPEAFTNSTRKAYAAWIVAPLLAIPQGIEAYLHRDSQAVNVDVSLWQKVIRPVLRF